MSLDKGSLPEFFRERIQDLLARRNVDLSDLTEVYLVNLLVGFLYANKLHQTKEGEDLDEPLALIYARALTAESITEQISLLRHIGDRSLYVSGFFADSFNRKIIDVDYYISIGTLAYNEASSVSPHGQGNKALPAVFNELAEKFSHLVDLLAEISETSGIHSNSDLLRLYERWLKTKSQRLSEMLQEEGILPIDDSSEWIH